MVNDEVVTRKIQVRLRRFVYIDFQPQISCLCDRNVFLSPGTGWVHFTWEIYLLLSGKKVRLWGGQSQQPLLQFSQTPAILDTRYAKVPYFEVARPEPLQYVNVNLPATLLII